MPYSGNFVNEFTNLVVFDFISIGLNNHHRKTIIYQLANNRKGKEAKIC
jgi:hypothetical protein